MLHMAKYEGYRKKRGATRKKNVMVAVMVAVIGDHTWNNVCWELDTSLQFTELCQLAENSVDCGVRKLPDGFLGLCPSTELS